MFAKRLAESKMGEAASWWDARDAAVTGFRRCQLRLLSTEAITDRWEAGGLINKAMWSEINRQLEWSHDMMKIHAENIDTCETCARSAEIAARIYYEEYEEREHGKE